MTEPKILEKNRRYYSKHKAEILKKCKDYYDNHKEHIIDRVRTKQLEKHEEYLEKQKQYHYDQRHTGKTRYCKINYECIENYELAKADNFDPDKWHLHHRLEYYWSKETLIKKGLYDNINPEALIWLPKEEHNFDYCQSASRPDKTKWHKRILELSK